MKLLYVGNFSQAHCTEVHLAKSFQLAGHVVDRVQEDTMHQEPDLLDRCLAADFVLFTRTWNHPAIAPLWQLLHSAGKLTVSFHLDLYVGIAREHEIFDTPFWHSDLIFSADGGNQEFFERHGIKHIWSPPAVYGPECNYEVTPDPQRFPHEVAFVGSPGPPLSYHPEWPYRTELLRKLKGRYGEAFGHRGVAGDSIRGHDLNVLYNTVPVIVGDSFSPGFTHKNYWSDRVPETIGRGGFLIHPDITGLGKQYVDGKHLMLYKYGDWDHLFHIIDAMLSAPENRNEVRRTGQAHVLANHTYVNRVEAMIKRIKQEIVK